MSSSSSSSSEPQDPVDQALELESLDVESLFRALEGVDKAIPHLLLSVKPILSHLQASFLPPTSALSEEDSGLQTRKSVERYVDLLDKIQYVLRQTIYFLRQKKVSPSTLRPPHQLPTPYAASLPPGTLLPGPQASKQLNESDEQVDLGLYASRIEARILRDIIDTLRDWKEASQDDMDVDSSQGTVHDHEP
ncbi:hypothetical protein M231_01748 [Tremella mesenterica]|uniref:Mediator complex subunit 11 n=1 Tax=Tremella mesenterica TaxID=5217 RepID=A0A4Q1BSG4_TREME|nr:hypothetical protein M231_01748 [Tremella mesenterica]